MKLMGAIFKTNRFSMRWAAGLWKGSFQVIAKEAADAKS